MRSLNAQIFQTNDALIAPLLRLNNCNVEESEKILKKHKKYSELIILYQTKGLHHKALELLEKQADQQDSSLRGVDRTIQYLQNLGIGGILFYCMLEFKPFASSNPVNIWFIGSNYIDLILRFAGWVLDKYPEEGLKIFTEDLLEVENLPRPKVLDYLLKTHRQLVIPYLVRIFDVLRTFLRGFQLLHFCIFIEELVFLRIAGARNLQLERQNCHHAQCTGSSVP